MRQSRPFLKPRVAPSDGIRRLAGGTVTAAANAPAVSAATEAPSIDGALAPAPTAAPESAAGSECAAAPFALATVPAADAVPAPAPVARPELRPVSADTYSLRVTLDAALKAELDQLVSLLSHKTGGNLAEVLREAIRCGIQKHGKRRGAVEPERKRARATKAVDAAAVSAANVAAAVSSANGGAVVSSANDAPAGAAEQPPETANPRNVPIDVCRAVWRRSGGRCEWTSPDGKRCGSTWKLEFGHVKPWAVGGLATVENVQVQCHAHNQYEALTFFGREHMAQVQPGLDFRQRK